MRPKEEPLYETIRGKLLRIVEDGQELPGIADPAAMDVLVMQLIDSIRRVIYVQRLGQRDISPIRSDPASEHFDPLRAAAMFHQMDMDDEACWLVFLSTYCGKHVRYGWKMTRDIYGALGEADRWTWERTSANPHAFRAWIGTHHGSIRRSFGNHRKFESLRPDTRKSPGNVVESYLAWVGDERTHAVRIGEAVYAAEGDRKTAFEHLFDSMVSVLSFGRTTRFDYLSMLGKLDLAPIEPGSAHLKGSTGPKSGARLLFGARRDAALEDRVRMLEARLPLGSFGMQVLEDALCNWQKSPRRYVRFRG